MLPGCLVPPRSLSRWASSSTSSWPNASIRTFYTFKYYGNIPEKKLFFSHPLCLPWTSSLIVSKNKENVKVSSEYSLFVSVSRACAEKFLSLLANATSVRSDRVEVNWTGEKKRLWTLKRHLRATSNTERSPSWVLYYIGKIRKKRKRVESRVLRGGYNYAGLSYLTTHLSYPLITMRLDCETGTLLYVPCSTRSRSKTRQAYNRWNVTCFHSNPFAVTIFGEVEQTAKNFWKQQNLYACFKECQEISNWWSL